MLSEWTILDIFYDGLSELSKMSLDHFAGGSIHLKKTPAEAQELIDMVANNQFMYTSKRNPVSNGTPMKKGVLEVDTLNAILAQNKILTQQVNMIPKVCLECKLRQAVQRTLHLKKKLMILRTLQWKR